MADVQYTIERLDKDVRSLEELATRDHLTGTYNRRAAEERLAEDVRRAERGGGALSLTLVDFDQLKCLCSGLGRVVSQPTFQGKGHLTGIDGQIRR